jgi:hypothetical protein
MNNYEVTFIGMSIKTRAAKVTNHRDTARHQADEVGMDEQGNLCGYISGPKNKLAWSYKNGEWLRVIQIPDPVAPKGERERKTRFDRIEPKLGDISDGSPPDAEGFRRYVRLANVATVEDQVVLFLRRASPLTSDSLRGALGKPLEVINKALKKLIAEKKVGVVRLGVEGHPGYVLVEEDPKLNKDELALKRVPLGVQVLTFLKAWGKPLTRDKIAESLKLRSKPSLDAALKRLMSRNLIECLKTESDPVYRAVKRKPFPPLTRKQVKSINKNFELGNSEKAIRQLEQSGSVKRVLDAAASAQGKKKRTA